MKWATIREAKAKLSEYVDLAHDEIVVITRHGRATAVLQGIEPDDLEEVLYESSERFRKLITSRRRTAREEVIPLATLKRRLRSPRSKGR